MLLLSESVSSLYLCFLARASAVSQQVQSASVLTISVDVTAQSSKCKLSGEEKHKQLCVHVLNKHENPALRHNKYLISQLLKEQLRSNACCHPNQEDLQQ